MTIEPFDFSCGVKFVIKAKTEAERVLLMACVGDTLCCGEDETEFILILEVSN